MSILTRVDDGSQQCQFAVRSGGHTPWAGAASSPDGVTIDLSLMNSTVYHSENTTASIDAGARWGSVYKALRPYGVAVTGGRSDSVGVGGLTTGGKSPGPWSGHWLKIARGTLFLCRAIRVCV